MTNLLPKPVRSLTQAEITVIEAGGRTDEEQRRIAALTKLAEIEARAFVYEEYINSQEWRDRADAAKDRVGRRCQVCYSPHNIQAHHRTYDRLGDELETDITVLCDECHELFHSNRRLKR